jgi:hypothetical protein
MLAVLRMGFLTMRLWLTGLSLPPMLVGGVLKYAQRNGLLSRTKNARSA